jgi:hypothetical protein
MSKVLRAGDVSRTQAVPCRSCWKSEGDHERTNGCDVAGDLIDFCFCFLGSKKPEVTLEALVCNGSSNKGGVCSQLELIGSGYSLGTDRSRMRARP